MKDPVVVDTNVLLAADGRADYSRDCASNCEKKLKQIEKRHMVVLDLGREILREYGRKVPHTKQPGSGYNFWKWLINNMANPDHCARVELTAHAAKGYVEFPDHDGLKNFDPSDRKFVAVAAAHPEKPEIIQATDTKWWGWKDALAECGIRVSFPCEDELKRKWEKKHGPNV